MRAPDVVECRRFPHILHAGAFILFVGVKPTAFMAALAFTVLVENRLAICAVDMPDEIMMAKERRKALLEVLKTLPDDAREMVKLRYFERLSAKEIAEITDSTEGAVRTRLHRILKQLKERCGHLYTEI